MDVFPGGDFDAEGEERGADDGEYEQVGDEVVEVYPGDDGGVYGVFSQEVV